MLIDKVLSQAASFNGFLITSLFPLLIAAACVLIQLVSPLYILGTLKGVSLGYCFISFFFIFGSAGWLLALLVMFLNFGSLILLHYLSLLCLSSNGPISIEDLLIAFILLIGIGIVDFISITPYTAFLISTL